MSHREESPRSNRAEELRDAGARAQRGIRRSVEAGLASRAPVAKQDPEQGSATNRSERACKPNSVSRSPGTRDHSSGPGVSPGLKQPTRRRPAKRDGTGALRLPIWPCSAWGLPCPRRCRRGGALLPHRFTLAVPGRLPGKGGLFSVALSFALPRPGITRHAARTEFGLSSPAWPGRSHSPLGRLNHSIRMAYGQVQSPGL